GLERCGTHLGHPGQEGRAEVEAHPGVVVEQIDDLTATVDQAGAPVGSVALAGDALVPVVVGMGGVLNLDRLQPRILAWRLIEVPMNADVARRCHPGASAWGRIDTLCCTGLGVSVPSLGCLGLPP